LILLNDTQRKNTSKNGTSYSVLLNDRKNKAFPEYFTSFLHQYIFSITDGNTGTRSTAQPASERTTEGDERLSRIYHDFDKIAFFLGFISDTNSQVNGASIRKVPAKGLFPVQIDLPNYHLVRKPLQSEPISSQDGSLIFLSLIVSTIRNTSKPQSRVEACDTVLALSERISDEAKLDRTLPYLITLLGDENAIVRVAALRAVTQLVRPIFQVY
jgi:phosphoinositide-3-kinase regulatory subunit 4